MVPSSESPKLTFHFFENLPDTAKNNGFEPNGAEYEPKGKTPTTLCRSRWFSALSPENWFLKFWHLPDTAQNNGLATNGG